MGDTNWTLKEALDCQKKDIEQIIADILMEKFPKEWGLIGHV